MPDDTAEYMLGDVRVTVVLMESDNSIDNGTITYPNPNNPASPFTHTYTPENWNAGAIAAVKAKVTDGLNWWRDTLDAMPNVRDGLLNFSIDWQYADAPVATPYEPIARISNDFTLWTYSFLNQVGFNQTGNFSSDIRAFNNFQRQQSGADWAFTIFVVNNANDTDKAFWSGGSFNNAFAFAGGRFEVVPASRPASTFAHETGHMFWAFDEYSNPSSNYLSKRGYYSTANSNHVSNPAPGFVQADSIMSADDLNSNPPILKLTNAYNGHTSPAATLQMIGWKDSDADGIFDVLDVPFKLDGVGRYDTATGLYHFTGSSKVSTLPNLNPSGLSNDITINQIRIVEASIDGGPWSSILTLPARTYTTPLDLSFAIPAGNHTIKLRTADTRTGVMSNEFIGNTSGSPTSTQGSGVGGFVFNDVNGNGVWDPTELPLSDFGLEIVDQDGSPIDLLRSVEPSVYPESTVLTSIHPEATITPVGGDTTVNEQQLLALGGTAGGTVTPSLAGVNGSPLTYQPGVSPTASQMLSSLNAIPGLAGNVLVSGANGGAFTVTFTGSLAKTNVATITQGGSTGGATLSATTLTEGVAPLVYARTSSLYPFAGKVFAAKSISDNRTVETWTTSSRQLKIEFQSPVSVVSIRAFSGSGTSFGRLEAFDSNGVLLERFTTDAITGSNHKVMSISRATADIAYVIARGHAGTEVVLDTLEWGAKTSATSNMQGAYSLPSLPAGTYHVQANAPPNHTVTTPLDGFAEITIVPGQIVQAVNFGIHVAIGFWHNVAFPLNVNNDPGDEITPIDALLIINWINSHPNEPELPSSGNPEVDGYIDVNNDNLCTPLDALLVINELNRQAVGGGGAEGGDGEGETPGLPRAGGGSAEGEDASQTPSNAAEYYAQNPVHFLQIAGADVPCGCEECLGKRAADAVSNGLPMISKPIATGPALAITVESTLGQNEGIKVPPARASALTPVSRTLQRRLASLPALAAKKVVAHEAAPKSNFDQALDDIAADVSNAAAQLPRPARKLRARS